MWQEFLTGGIKILHKFFVYLIEKAIIQGILVGIILSSVVFILISDFDREDINEFAGVFGIETLSDKIRERDQTIEGYKYKIKSLDERILLKQDTITELEKNVKLEACHQQLDFFQVRIQYGLNIVPLGGVAASTLQATPRY